MVVSESKELNRPTEEGLTKKHSNKEITKTDISHDCDVTNQIPVSVSDVISTDSLENGTSPKHDPVDNHSTSSDSHASFHDNAYKSSLRNLLRKSLSFTPTEKTSSTQQPYLSESDDITDNTVIEAQHDDRVQSAEDSLVNTVVETAIKAATDDIIKERANDRIVNPVMHDEPELPSESTWGTPKLNANEEESFILLDPSTSPTNLDQSTSTKVTASHDGSSEPLAKSTRFVKPKLEESPNFPPRGTIELSRSFCFRSTITDDLTMLQPVSDYIMDETKENCDPTIETGTITVSGIQ